MNVNSVYCFFLNIIYMNLYIYFLGGGVMLEIYGWFRIFYFDLGVSFGDFLLF